MTENNFYSIDRLLEFGMGMALAQKMVATMNQSFSPINPTSNAHNYFAALEGKAAGPFSEAEVGRLIVDGKVTKETLIWRQGMPRWQIAAEVADIMRLVALAPPPLPNGD